VPSDGYRARCDRRASGTAVHPPVSTCVVSKATMWRPPDGMWRRCHAQKRAFSVRGATWEVLGRRSAWHVTRPTARKSLHEASESRTGSPQGARHMPSAARHMPRRSPPHASTEPSQAPAISPKGACRRFRRLGDPTEHVAQRVEVPCITVRQRDDDVRKPVLTVRSAPGARRANARARGVSPSTLSASIRAHPACETC
jgi:hypothetical protein